MQETNDIEAKKSEDKICNEYAKYQGIGFFKI